MKMYLRKAKDLICLEDGLQTFRQEVFFGAVVDVLALDLQLLRVRDVEVLLFGVVVHRRGPWQVDHRDDHLRLGLQSPQRNSLDHAGLLLPVKNELGPESPDADAALVAAAAAAAAAAGVQQFEARLADAFEERRFADWNADLKKS